MNSSGDPGLDQQARLYLTRRVEEVRKDNPETILVSTTEDDDNVPDLERELGGDVFNAAELTTCKKSDKKAVPALVVSGPGLGRIKWVQPIRYARHVESSADRSEGNGQSPSQPYAVTEKTPEEKKEPYDKRRRQVVIDAVQAKLRTLAEVAGLEEAKTAEGGNTLACKGLLLKTLILLRALIGDHGWRATASGSLELPEQFPWASLDTLKNHELGTGVTRDAALALCWEMLRLALAKMASRLALGMGERSNEIQYTEAVEFCDLLQFDLTALRTDAATAIPYAKSWKDQVADDWAPANSSENGSPPPEGTDGIDESEAGSRKRNRKGEEAAANVEA